MNSRMFVYWGLLSLCLLFLERCKCMNGSSRDRDDKKESVIEVVRPTAHFPKLGPILHLCFFSYQEPTCQGHACTTYLVTFPEVRSHTGNSRQLNTTQLLLSPSVSPIGKCSLTLSPHPITLSLLRMAATLFWRLSQRWLPSCTICFSLLAESVRFSRARRLYCLLISSN